MNTNIKSRIRFGIIATIVISGALPFAGSFFLPLYHPHWHWVQEPLHSVVETAGALIALRLTILLLSRMRVEEDVAYFTWIASAFLAMGLLDLLHAAVSMGPGVTRARGLFTLIGGVLFNLVWLPGRFARSRFARALPAIAGATALVASILIISFPHTLAALMDRPGYTLARMVNYVGGSFFLAAAACFLLRYHRRRRTDDVVFANQSLLFGIAGLAYSHSSLWTSTWWAWHLVRLVGYLIVLGFGSVSYQRLQEKLRRSETGNRALVDAIPDLIFRFRCDGTLLDFHSHDWSSFRADPHAMIGMNICDSPMPRNVVEDIMSAARRAVQSRQVQTLEFALHRGISWRHFESRLVASGPDEIVSVVRNITEHKKAHEEMDKREATLRNVMAAVPCPTIIIRPDHTVVYFNSAAEKITGYAASEVLGKDYLDIFMPDEEVRRRVQASLDQLPIHGETRDSEGPLRLKDGSQRWFIWNGQLLPDYEGGPAFLGLALDITERRLAEKALRGSQEQMRALAGHLISLKEEESKRLAQELHNAFSQRLAGLGIGLAALAQEVREPSEAPIASLRRLQEEMGRLATEFMRLSGELHPSILDDLGLTTTLQAECEAFSRKHGVSARFIPTDLPDSVPSGLSLSLYRIAQESLWNIAQHAEADEVWLFISHQDGHLVLAVEDNGKGFDPAQIKGKGGLGLATMEERARLAQGSFVVQSEPGKGTRVEVRIPLPQRVEVE